MSTSGKNQIEAQLTPATTLLPSGNVGVSPIPTSTPSAPAPATTSTTTTSPEMDSPTSNAESVSTATTSPATASPSKNVKSTAATITTTSKALSTTSTASPTLTDDSGFDEASEDYDTLGDASAVDNGKFKSLNDRVYNNPGSCSGCGLDKVQIVSELDGSKGYVSGEYGGQKEEVKFCKNCDVGMHVGCWKEEAAELAKAGTALKCPGCSKEVNL